MHKKVLQSLVILPIAILNGIVYNGYRKGQANGSQRKEHKEMKGYKMKITYYHTLYEREITKYVFGEIEFDGNEVVFASAGHKHRVETKYVRKIESIEE